MTQKYKANFFTRITAFLLIASFASTYVFIYPVQKAEAMVPIFFIPTGPFGNFGGMILEKNLYFCLKKAPPPVFIIIIPFRVYAVGPPKPAGLYWLYGISQLKKEWVFEKTANALGNYVIGAHEGWKAFCDINGETLPRKVRTKIGDIPVLGVTWKMGTSCKTDPKARMDGCHLRLLAEMAKDVATFYAQLAIALAAINSAMGLDASQFNSQDSDYTQYCDQNGPTNDCYPPGTCDPQQSQLAGSCVDSSGDPVTGVGGGLINGNASNCTYSLSPASKTLTYAQQEATFGISSQTGCAWSASTNASWIDLSNNSGAGSGSVLFGIMENTGSSRTGTITAGGQTFTVTQTGK